MEKIFLNKGHDYCTSYVASLIAEIFAVPTVLLIEELSSDYYHYLFKIRFPHYFVASFCSLCLEDI